MAGISTKVAHVKAATQTRTHHCHWPGCTRQVPPAMWGCRTHWYSLPNIIRNAIWRAYAPGQEATGRPSRQYIEAARAAQDWIVANHPPKPAAVAEPVQQSLI